MTMQELLVESLERIGAAGFAFPATATEFETSSRVINRLKSLESLRETSLYGSLFPQVLNLRRIVVWASADGTLFPSAEERDAHDGVVITNEKHFGAKCSWDNNSAEARAAQCKKQLCSDCRIGFRAAAENRCYREWDKAPYGMPLDKRIPWPKP